MLHCSKDACRRGDPFDSSTAVASNRSVELSDTGVSRLSDETSVWPTEGELGPVVSDVDAASFVGLCNR